MAVSLYMGMPLQRKWEKHAKDMQKYETIWKSMKNEKTCKECYIKECQRLRKAGNLEIMYTVHEYKPFIQLSLKTAHQEAVIRIPEWIKASRGCYKCF